MSFLLGYAAQVELSSALSGCGFDGGSGGVGYDFGGGGVGVVLVVAVLVVMSVWWLCWRGSVGGGGVVGGGCVAVTLVV